MLLGNRKMKRPDLSGLFWTVLDDTGFDAGGAEGDRTPDLMTASHALSQLSYNPTNEDDYQKRSRGVNT
jgi:hypothetical protein